jgi:drug/metabolite transporter (DMT)-like permease
MQRKTNDTTTWLVLGLLGLLFGSAFLFTRVLVDAMTPLQLVAWRLLLATAAVLAISVVRHDLPTPNRQLVAGSAVLAIFDGFAPYILISWASQELPGGTTAVLMSTMPLFTAIFAATTRRQEPLSSAAIAGLALGFGGVVVLLGPGALDVRHGVGLSHVLVILAAASYGAAAVYARELSKTQSVIDITVLKMPLATAVAVAFALAVDGPGIAPSLSTTEMASLLALGVLSTGLGRLIFLWVIARAGSVRASLVTYVIPISALTLGWLLLGEPVHLRTLVGTALIVIGVVGVVSGNRIEFGIRSLFAQPKNRRLAEM